MVRVRVMFGWKAARLGNEIQIENGKGEDEQASIRVRKFMMNWANISFAPLECMEIRLKEKMQGCNLDLLRRKETLSKLQLHPYASPRYACAISLHETPSHITLDMSGRSYRLRRRRRFWSAYTPSLGPRIYTPGPRRWKARI